MLLGPSISHRIYSYLQVRWCCPLTIKHVRPHPLAPVRPLVAAAFRDGAAATEWQRLANELNRLYSKCGDVAQVSNLMRAMTQLLPFAGSVVVQRVLRLPLLNVDIGTPGRFLYCLLSPLLGKVYVGAVGFKRPRSPYARLREHFKMAKLWASSASLHRYGCRTPGLYRAVSKVGIENVVQVILAEATAEKLAATECTFIRSCLPFSTSLVYLAILLYLGRFSAFVVRRFARTFALSGPMFSATITQGFLLRHGPF